MKKEKRIPTILGLVLLIGGIVGGVFLTKQRTGLNSKASGDCVPINPQVTNITHNSFVVSFITNASCLSNVSVNNQNYTDIRFINTGIKEISTDTHYFSIENLKENTEYQYSIISNGQVYSKSTYQIKTADTPNSAAMNSNLAWGRVLSQDQTPGEGSIVYLNIPGASALSALVTSNGNWNISLASSFNETKTNWFTPPKNLSEDLIVLSSGNQVTQVAGSTSQNDPVPDIIIGVNNLNQLPDTGSENVDTPAENLNLNTPVTPVIDLTIDNPQENETIFTATPDFFGKGPINSQLTIKLTPSSSQNSAAIDNNGQWHWSSSKNLTPGTYTLSVSTNSKTVNRVFSVAVQGNVGMAFTASNSATVLTPTTSPNPTSTPTSTPTINSPSPTITSSSTITSSPTATPSMPKTGMSLPTVALIGIALIFMFSPFIFKL